MIILPLWFSPLLIVCLVCRANSFTAIYSHCFHNLYRFKSMMSMKSTSAPPIAIIVPNTANSASFLSAVGKHFPAMKSTSCNQLSNEIMYLLSNEGMKFNENSDISHMDSIFMIFENCCTNDSIERNIARKACKYDFYVPNYQSNFYRDLSEAEYHDMILKRFRRFIEHLSIPTNHHITTSSSSSDVKLGKWSHFLSLTYSSIDEAVPYVHELRKGIDAYELRVDMLSNVTDISLQRQIALLRDCSPLSIVYTVRTAGQLGRYPDQPSKAIVRLLQQGLRAGVEYLDVEACLPPQAIELITIETIEKYHHRSKIIGSLHVTIPQSSSQIHSMLDQCNLYGRADILKVVTGAANDDDCRHIHDICSRNRYHKPYIGLCLGLAGARSRVSNQQFTPVTHKLMSAAAPGQLSVDELMKKRIELGLIKSKKYYLYGTPIKHSMSPSMHNAAYHTLLLPHHYQLHESDDVEVYRDMMDRDDFGGASVTIPHKETIIPMLDEVVGAAREIGAVNTIVIDKDGKKIGYNTDWLGMLRPIARLMRQRNERHHIATASQGVGIVLGAGGTAKAACYAIKQLGLDLIICNRTPEKSYDIETRYGGISMELHDVVVHIDISQIQVIISTIPSQAEIIVPSHLLMNKPIVFDVVYKPSRTKLLIQALEAGCPVIQGASMLLEQGLEQFELWHFRVAPREEMEAAVFQGIEKITSL